MTPRFGLWPVVAFLLPVLLANPAAAAATVAETATAANTATIPGTRAGANFGAETCERAIVAGAQRQGVPEDVLHAISLTETGRPEGGRLRPWPWAINREGQGFWFKSRDEALAFAKASLAAGRTSFDVGCFQINYRYHGMNFRSLEAMFEPDEGATYAAQFLRSLYHGNWSAAAGAYHSQTPERASVYRARFDRILAGLGGQPLAVPAAEPGPTTVETPEAPRKSRTRLTKGPKIINLPKKATPPAEEANWDAPRLPAPGGGGLRPIQASLSL